MDVEQGRRERTKFIAYFELLDAMREAGCPFCTLVVRSSRRYLDALLYEQVNDPGTREKLRAARGFCAWHAWMAAEIANSASGIAIIHRDFLAEEAEALRRLQGSLGPRSAWQRLCARWGRRHEPDPVVRRATKDPCPACASGRFFEQVDLLTLLDFLRDPQMERAFDQSDGPCLPHLYRAVEYGRDHPNLGLLLGKQVARFRRLLDEMDEYLRKLDYRFSAEPKGAEQTSPLRSIELFAGKRGVFGNERWARPAPAEPGSGVGEEGRSAVRPFRSSGGPGQAQGAGGGDEVEALRFENEKLRRQIEEARQAWNEEGRRAASLHYRVACLLEDKRKLELNVAGARGLSEGWEPVVQALRDEVARLQGRLEAAEKTGGRRPGGA